MKKHQLVSIFMLVLLIPVFAGRSYCQVNNIIHGRVTDREGLELPYCTAALYRAVDSLLITGGVTSDDGLFELETPVSGECILRVSFVGYERFEKLIMISENGKTDAGTVVLNQGVSKVPEAVIIADRIKGKETVKGTTYYVNSSIDKASSSGVDLVKFIPGVSVDLLGELKLEGKSNIVIEVNGKERDLDYLRQLDSDLIDKIEVNTSAGPGYKSGIDGVINIVLKKDRAQGYALNLNTELPIKRREVYAFPAAGISYTRGKSTFYLSYNGEFSYFNASSDVLTRFYGDTVNAERRVMQSISQDTWSHKVHLGYDFDTGSGDQLSIYAYANPYSDEHSSDLEITSNPADTFAGDYMTGVKTDEDLNLSLFTSVFYRHIFGRADRSISLNINYFENRSSSATHYDYNSVANNQYSVSRPLTKSFDARVDFSQPLNEKYRMDVGTRFDYRIMEEDNYGESYYSDYTAALYSAVKYTSGNTNIEGGIRFEAAGCTNIDQTAEVNYTLFPSFSYSYKINEGSTLSLRYRKSLVKPYKYQLNPVETLYGPFTLRSGNPFLKPVTIRSLRTEYSILAGANYISAGPYIMHKVNVIERLVSLNSNGLLIRHEENAGNITRMGCKLRAGLKPFRRAQVNPFIDIFRVETKISDIAGEYGLSNRAGMVIDFGLSMSVIFRYDIALSAGLSYCSELLKIQDNYSEDMIVFISAEKKIAEKLKAGIVLLNPFWREVTYQKNRISGAGFTELTENNILCSALPLNIRLKYSFSTGKKARRVERNNTFIEHRDRKGF